MVIAVNARFLIKGSLEGYGYFFRETLRRITKNNPQHEFVFLFDREFDPEFIFSENVKGIVVKPAARHPVLWKWWMDYRVPAVLKKLKADCFLSFDGFCSLRTEVPQMIVIHDLAFAHYPEHLKRSHLWYYRHYMRLFAEKASVIATVSEFSREDIVQQLNLDRQKIDVVYSAAKDSFMPIEDHIITETREKYTGGHQYFLFTGAIHPRKNLRNLLRAFSVFKKRMNSSMKLVIAGRVAWNADSFINDLKTYKYRHDVIMTGYVPEDELVKITASAYAMMYVSLFEGFGVPVLEAMRSGVPVISSSSSSMEEIAGNAALFANPHDHVDIAEKMMKIYQDESLRGNLVKYGFEKEKEFSWERTTALLEAAIKKALPEF